MNIHLISYEKNISKSIVEKYKNVKIYEFYRYLEATNAVRNSLHVETWRNLKNENGLIIEDYNYLNDGIMLYSELITKFLNNFCKDWEIIFLDSSSYLFWENQKQIVRPEFTNSWGGFGDYVSSFFLKRIMENNGYQKYDNKCPLNFSTYIINHNKIDNFIEKIEKLNLIEESIENLIYKNMELFKLYIVNPRINLTKSFIANKKESDVLFQFSWPPEEKNIYNIPILDHNYNFEFNITESIIENINHLDLQKMLKFKVNSLIIEKPKMFIYTDEDHLEGTKLRKIRFTLEELKTKMRKNNLHEFSEHIKLEISLKINNCKYSGRTIFSFKKNKKILT
jgi:hypothetical protein